MEVSRVNSPNFGMAIRILPSTEKYMKKTLTEDELRLIKKLMLKNKNLEQDVVLKVEDPVDGSRNRTFQAIVGDKTYVKDAKASTLGFLEKILKNIKN
jgi:hypothetical protein